MNGSQAVCRQRRRVTASCKLPLRPGTKKGFNVYGDGDDVRRVLAAVRARYPRAPLFAARVRPSLRPACAPLRGAHAPLLVRVLEHVPQYESPPSPPLPFWRKTDGWKHEHTVAVPHARTARKPTGIIICVGHMIFRAQRLRGFVIRSRDRPARGPAGTLPRVGPNSGSSARVKSHGWSKRSSGPVANVLNDCALGRRARCRWSICGTLLSFRFLVFRGHSLAYSCTPG